MGVIGLSGQYTPFLWHCEQLPETPIEPRIESSISRYFQVVTHNITGTVVSPTRIEGFDSTSFVLHQDADPSTCNTVDRAGTVGAGPIVITISPAPKPEFTINFTTFIPGNNLNALLPCNTRLCSSGSGLFPPKVSFPLYVRLDDRGFDPSATTYRTRQLVTVIPDESADPDGLKEGTKFNDAHPTELYASDALPIIDDNDDDAQLCDCHLLHDIVPPVKDMHVDVTRTGPKTVGVHLFGHAGTSVSDPIFHIFRPCPISWDILLHIDTSGPRPTVAISGAHDGFPAYEVYVNNHPVHRYPVPPPLTPTDLFKLCGTLGATFEDVVELPD